MTVRRYYYSAMEVETRSPSSRVIVASFYGQGARECPLGRPDRWSTRAGRCCRSAAPARPTSLRIRIGRTSKAIRRWLSTGRRRRRDGKTPRRTPWSKEHDTVSTVVISHPRRGRRIIDDEVRFTDPVGSLLKTDIILLTRKWPAATASQRFTWFHVAHENCLLLWDIPTARYDNSTSGISSRQRLTTHLSGPERGFLFFRKSSILDFKRNSCCICLQILPITVCQRNTLIQLINACRLLNSLLCRLPKR